LRELGSVQPLIVVNIYIPAKSDRKIKIPPGTPFEEIPNDWRCPVCGASKKAFRPMSEVEKESSK